MLRKELPDVSSIDEVQVYSQAASFSVQNLFSPPKPAPPSLFDSEGLAPPRHTLKVLPHSFEPEIVDPQLEKYYRLKSLCDLQLYNMAMKPLGRFSGPVAESNKTMEVILQLVRLRKKDLVYRDQIAEKLARLESDKNISRSNAESLKRQLEAVNKKHGALENKMQMQKGEKVSEQEKNKAELGEAVKQKLKLERNVQHLQMELKKKEQQIIKIKEQFKKPDKAGPTRNSFEVVASLRPLQLEQVPPEGLFFQMTKARVESRLGQLQKEHTQLRQALEYIFEETESLLFSLCQFFGKQSSTKAKCKAFVPMTQGRCEVQMAFKAQLDEIKSLIKGVPAAKPKEPQSTRKTLRQKPLETNEDLQDSHDMSVLSKVSSIPPAGQNSKKVMKELEYWSDILAKEV